MTWNAVKNYVWLNPHNACDCQLAETGRLSRSALILIVCTVAGCNPRSGDVWENVGFHLSATKPWWNNPCFMVSLGIWNWRSLSTATSRKAVLLSWCKLPGDNQNDFDLPTPAENKTSNRILDYIYISFSFIVPTKNVQTIQGIAGKRICRIWSETWITKPCRQVDSASTSLSQQRVVLLVLE